MYAFLYHYFNKDTEMVREFLAEAQAAGLSGLAGHRAIGGIRASLYNAVTREAVEELVGFMDEFRRRRLQNA